MIYFVFGIMVALATLYCIVPKYHDSCYYDGDDDYVTDRATIATGLAVLYFAIVPMVTVVVTVAWPLVLAWGILYSMATPRTDK